MDFFPKNQFLVIDGSALNEHPAHQIVRIEQFLNLDLELDSDSFIKVPERGVFCLKGTEGKPCCANSSKVRL